MRNTVYTRLSSSAKRQRINYGDTPPGSMALGRNRRTCRPGSNNDQVKLAGTYFFSPSGCEG